MEAAEGVLGHVRRRLPQDVELARVLDVVELVPHPVLVQPLGAQLELGRGPAAGVGFVELVDVHRRHTIADLGDRRCRATDPPDAGRGGSDRGSAGRHGGAMAITTSRPRVALIDQMAAEWQSIGRSRERRPRPRRRWPDRRSGTGGPRARHRRRAAAVPLPLRRRRPHAACVGASAAGGGGSPGPGAAPGGRRRSLHLPDAGPGPGPRARHGGRKAAVGPRRGVGGRRGVLRRAAVDGVAGPAGVVRAGPPLRRARPPLRHPLPPSAPALPVQGGRRTVRPAGSRRTGRRVRPAARPTSRNWRGC